MLPEAPGGQERGTEALRGKHTEGSHTPTPPMEAPPECGEEDALGKILTCDCYKGMDILTTDRLISVLKRNRGLLVFLLLVTEEINRTVQNFNQGCSA